MHRRLLQRSFLPAGALVIVAGLGAPANAADAHYRVVARTGQPAPGGGVYTSLGAPRISADGRVAFVATVNGAPSPSGVWSEGVSGMNNLQLAAREGDPVPGLPGTFLGPLTISTTNLIVNESGAAAFSAPIVGVQSQFGDVAILRHDGSGLDVRAAPGQTVTLPCGGLGCSRWLTDITPSSLAFNAAGEIAFHSHIAGTGVNADNDTAVFVRTDAGLQVALREGDTPPGTFGVVYSDAHTTLPMLNDNGEIFVCNFLRDLNVDMHHWSVWRGAPGALSLIAGHGWTTPAGGEFNNDAVGIGVNSFNNAGQGVFPQTFNNPLGGWPEALWLFGDGGVLPLSHGGMDAPDGYEHLYTFMFSAAINGSGDTVFGGSIQGPGVDSTNNEVLVRRWANGESEIIARRGDSAPGLLASSLYGEIIIGTWTILNDGRVVYSTRLTGPGNHEGNNRMLWITRNNGTTVGLLRKGQTMVVGGQLRTVESTLGNWSWGPESGKSFGVSHYGQVALRVDFTDGTEAIIVASPKSACPGDVNGDGVVDFTDFSIVLAAYGHIGSVVLGDLDLDGDVDFSDFSVVLQNYGVVCGN